jgi:hypothetical protein
LLINKRYEVKWTGINIKYFKSLGYNFTRKNDTFLVSVFDLSTKSSKFVDISCDYCGTVFKRRMSDHSKITENEVIKKDACENCSSLKKKEILQYRQENNLLTKNADGYWTFKENRLKELNAYIDKNGHADVMNDINAKSLKIAIERYDGNVMHLLYELGYENAKELINHKLPFYYDDFENIRKEIQLFIDKYNHFPTQQELAHELKINQLQIAKHGGIYEIKRRMKYSDKSGFIDDNGFINSSYYEYVTAQFLIHNTKINYKREQHPFPNDEPDYRSDFTFYLDNEDSTIIHVELWGYGEYEDGFQDKYGKRKIEKIKLYKKYNINLIEIDYKVFYNKSLDTIQKGLSYIFEPYLKLKYKKIDNDFIVNPNISDDYLFNELMKFSEDGSKLPKSSNLKGTEGYKLYKEAQRRYGSYQIFAEKFNSETHHRTNYWCKEKIYAKLLSLVNSGEVISGTRLRELKLNSLECAINKFGSMIQTKLDFYSQFIDKINNLHTKEYKFITNVINNQGTNIRNKVTPEQQEQAKQILEKYKIQKVYEVPTLQRS